MKVLCYQKFSLFAICEGCVTFRGFTSGLYCLLARQNNGRDNHATTIATTTIAAAAAATTTTTTVANESTFCHMKGKWFIFREATLS